MGTRKGTGCHENNKGTLSLEVVTMASLWEFHLNRVPKGKERRKDIPGRENNFSEDSEIGKKVDFLEKVRTVCPGETRV